MRRNRCQSKKQRCRLAAAVLAAVMPAAGCAGPRVSGKHRLLPSTQAFEFDIPLPSGFELVDQSTADWSGDTQRYLRHRYRGRADKRAVETFYREEMPLVRWTLVSENQSSGRMDMRFTKGKESCLIAIENDLRGLIRHVAVEVIIAPTTER